MEDATRRREGGKGEDEVTQSEIDAAYTFAARMMLLGFLAGLILGSAVTRWLS